MSTLDDLELELRKLPGVRATGFSERDDVLLVQIHVGEEETEPGMPLQATRIAYRYSDRPVAVELVRWRTRRATQGTAGHRQPPTAPPPQPEPPPRAAATTQTATAPPEQGPPAYAPPTPAPPPPPATTAAPETAQPQPPETAAPTPPAATTAPPPRPHYESAAPHMAPETSAASPAPLPAEPAPAPPRPPQPSTDTSELFGAEPEEPLPSAPDQAGWGTRPPDEPTSQPPEGGERRSDTGDEDRVRLLAVLTFPDTDELEVHLTLAARRTIGRAAASRGLLAAVEATLDALRGFVPNLAYEPAWARTLETSTGDGFLVAAGLTGVETQKARHGLASGASAIEAAARATLQALNRSIVLELTRIRTAAGG